MDEVMEGSTVESFVRRHASSLPLVVRLTLDQPRRRRRRRRDVACVWLHAAQAQQGAAAFSVSPRVSHQTSLLDRSCTSMRAESVL